MLKFHVFHVFEKMKEEHMTETDLRSIGIDSLEIEKLKNDASVPLSVINKLCRLLRCQPGDLIGYVDDLTPGADERFC